MKLFTPKNVAQTILGLIATACIVAEFFVKNRAFGAALSSTLLVATGLNLGFIINPVQNRVKRYVILALAALILADGWMMYATGKDYNFNSSPALAIASTVLFLLFAGVAFKITLRGWIGIASFFVAIFGIVELVTPGGSAAFYVLPFVISGLLFWLWFILKPAPKERGA